MALKFKVAKLIGIVFLCFLSFDYKEVFQYAKISFTYIH